MWRGLPVLGLVAVLLAFAEAGAAQQEQKPKELPDAPVPKQEPAEQKHENPLEETFSILGRRSIFFPELAASRGPRAAQQETKIRAFCG